MHAVRTALADCDLIMLTMRAAPRCGIVASSRRVGPAIGGFELDGGRDLGAPGRERTTSAIGCRDGPPRDRRPDREALHPVRGGLRHRAIRRWALLKLTEEVGELAQAHLTATGQSRDRGLDADAQRKVLADEVGDVLGMRRVYALQMGIDPVEAVTTKWFQYEREARPAGTGPTGAGPTDADRSANRPVGSGPVPVAERAPTHEPRSLRQSSPAGRRRPRAAGTEPPPGMGAAGRPARPRGRFAPGHARRELLEEAGLAVDVGPILDLDRPISASWGGSSSSPTA